MATIESLGAALFRRLEQTGQQVRPVRLPKQESKAAEPAPLPVAVETAAVPEEAKLPGTTPNQLPQADTGSSSRPVKHQEQMSLEELAAMLRKVNLTFDLFEIQAKYAVDLSTGDITVQVINQRTGEVIRKIPPYDLPKLVKTIDENQITDSAGPLLADIKA
jgi:uncharacterized FlaG/YvyC family protein